MDSGFFAFKQYQIIQLLATRKEEIRCTRYFKACMESLSSENASRLNAMQPAEKSIDELFENQGFEFNQLRQSSIGEELFAVVSEFEISSKTK